MPRKTAHLQYRDGRHFYARVAVPVGLRSVLGKRELTAPLGPDRSLAIKALPGVVAEMKEQIRAARNQNTDKVIHQLVQRSSAPLSNRQMAQVHYQSELELDRARRFEPAADDARLWSIQRRLIEAASDGRNSLPEQPDYSPSMTVMATDNGVYRAVLTSVASGKASTDEADAAIGWAIDSFHHRGNTTVQRGSAEWRKLAADLAAIQLEVLRRADERDTGIFDEQSKHPHLAPATAQPNDPLAARMIGPDSAKTLTELLTDFMKERKASASNNYEHTVTVRMFGEVQGDDLPAYKITRQHVQKFKKALAEAPSNYTKRFPGKTLLEAIVANSARKAPFPILSSKTVNDKYLSKLHAFFAWCVRNDVIPDNPAALIKVDIVGDEGGRVDFKPNDLSRIFAKDRFAAKGELGEFEWATLISLFSGLRASELAQTQLDSIRHERGILCFVIEEKTKNKNSQRLVPVHDQLVSLGLEKRIARLRKQKETHLFPDWYKDGMRAKAEATKKGKLTLNHYFPRFIPKTFNNTYLPAVGIDEPRKTWHSFRHTFKTGLKRAGVTKDLRDELCGHKDYSAGAGYEHDQSVEAMKAAVERLHFDGLDLTRFSSRAPS
jgi:integrase